MYVLLLIHQALAATPVRLPPGESPAAWTESLALAGLTIGDPGAGVGADVAVVDGRWVVRARDAAGMVHQTAVVAPTTDQTREDFAWLVASLVRPIGEVGIPSGAVGPVGVIGPASVARQRVVPVRPVAAPPPAVVTAPAPTPPAPTPPAVAASITAPSAPPPAAGPPGELAAAALLAPIVAPPGPASVVPTPAATAATPPAEPPSPRPPSAFDTAFGTGVSWRAGADPFAVLTASAGVTPGIPVRFGLRGERSLASELVVIGEGRSVTTWGAAVTATWASGRRWTPTLGLDAGLAWRRYAEADALVVVVPTPVLGGGVGLPIPVWRGLSIEPALGLAADLRPTDLIVPGTAVQTLSPWTVQGGITLRSTLAMRGAE